MLKQYTLFAPEVQVRVREVEYLLVAKECVATKVHTLVIELSMYKGR